MKKFLLFCTGVVLVITVSPSFAAYVVDLGSWNPSGAILVGWGPVQPATSGGNWGGFGSGNDNHTPPVPPTWDYICRTVWDPGELDVVNANWAQVVFPGPVDKVTIRHLDGIATDGAGGGGDDFEVYVDGVLWGSYISNPATNEYWEFSEFTGTPGTTLMIVATDPQWGSFGTYGQLGIDRIVGIPEPATMMLLGLGGLALLRKRRA
jgi:hypothetical protein